MSSKVIFKAATGVALGMAVLALLSCSKEAEKPKVGSAGYEAFKNSVDTPPPGSTGNFKLSANYPKEAGECAECDWLKLPVSFQTTFPPKPNPNAWTEGRWAEYINLMLTYVKQGQDLNLADKVGWKTEVGGKTRWFNVPWMAYDPTVGREFRHGTTNERTAHLQDLIGPDGKDIPDSETSLGGAHFFPNMSESCKARYPNGFETWSVGYYNPQGGYALGKSIPRDGVPRTGKFMGSDMPAGLPFPNGTTVMKVLTTTAPVDCVPFLKGSPVWTVNRHVLNPATKQYMCERQVQETRVVQIDVATADNRSPTGWVYGTFAYDGNKTGATFWDRLTPLGVQWGADPWTFPAVPEADSKPLQQSVANPNVGMYQHMGCRGRLAGPVDNPQSSCMSCHSSAYAAKDGAKSVMGQNVPPSFGFDGLCEAYSLDNAGYFQNQPAPQSFGGGKYPNAMSLDTSLQMEVAYQSYGQFKTDGKPVACVNPS